jgi:hypothetical protein
VHQGYYVVVKQEGATDPKPAQRLGKKPLSTGPRSWSAPERQSMAFTKRADLVSPAAAIPALGIYWQVDQIVQPQFSIIY